MNKRSASSAGNATIASNTVSGYVPVLANGAAATVKVTVRAALNATPFKPKSVAAGFEAAATVSAISVAEAVFELVAYVPETPPAPVAEEDQSYDD